MKHLISILLLALTFLVAKPIDKEQANNVALNFATLNNKTLTLDAGMSRMKRSAYSLHQKDKETPYYFINLKPKGWVLVSGNDVIDPIIGFSFDANIDTNHSLPPQLVDMLDGIESTINYIESQGTYARTKNTNQWDELSVDPALFKANIEDFRIRHKTSRETKKTVGPLLTSQWRQDAPYNTLIPIVDPLTGEHALVGCVATAIAQIMNYHKWPKKGKGKHPNMQHSNLTIDFDTTYNWTNMTNYDKAKISYHIGVGIDTKYVPGKGSFAFLDTVPHVLRDNFYYSSSEKEMRFFDLISHGKWDKRIQKNIDKHLPILYEGRHTYLSTPHAFVCDGYTYVNNKPYYHFNFGLDFRVDAFYNIHPTTTPDISFIHYYRNNYAIFDIKPKRIEEPTMVTQFQGLLPSLLMTILE